MASGMAGLAIRTSRKGSLQMNHETLFRIVLQALQNPQPYSIPRQLGLYMWMASQHDTSMKTYEAIYYSDSFHRDYSRNVPINTQETVRYVLADTAWLSRQYPYGDGINPDNEYKNLLIMSNNRAWGVAELNIDETAVIQALLNQHYGQVETVDRLTDDSSLALQVLKVYTGMKERLSAMNAPFVWRAGLSLPIPQSPADYIKRMKYAIHHHIEVGAPKERAFHPKQLGDVARRLRSLGMYQEHEGSIRGAYLGAWQKLKWEVLSVDEQAAYENRILGAGQFELEGLGDTMVMMIARDRFKDGLGYQFIVATPHETRLISLDNDGEVTVSAYGNVSADFEGLHYGGKELEAAIEAWEDGLRVAAWLSLFFEIVDKRFNQINKDIVCDFLKELLS